MEEARATGDATADAEYQRAKRDPQEKVERLDREGRTADEQRRRSIIDAAMRGEAEAKNEFATAEPADRHRVRPRAAKRPGAKPAAASPRSPPTSTQASTRPPRNTPPRVKPILDLVRMADGLRERLAAVAADYAKFGLNPEPPIASEEDYAKFEDPVDEVFNRLARMEPHSSCSRACSSPSR